MVNEQSAIATKLYQLHGSLEILKKQDTKVSGAADSLSDALQKQIDFYTEQLTPVSRKLIKQLARKNKRIPKRFLRIQRQG